MDDLLEGYRQASKWTLSKVRGATDLMDATTPCDGWDVRTLLNHMLDTERYFAASARGEEASLPASVPPEMLGDDPVEDFERAQSSLLDAYSSPEVRDRMGPALGIAMADQLLHGWDLARATGQDSAMPDDLAATAFRTIHGRFTDEQRSGVFKPEIPTPADASDQERLLAYTGRAT
jgi:uncharacterized protein (TIGR03086 family)